MWVDTNSLDEKNVMSNSELNSIKNDCKSTSNTFEYL